MNNMRKDLVIFGVIMCILVGGYKIYDFVQKRMPVAKEGKCISITAPTNKSIRFKIYVVRNDILNGSADIIVDTGVNGMLIPVTDVSNEELNKLNPKPVGCDEEVR